VKPVDPAMIEVSEVPQEASVTELQEQLFEIRGETRILNRDLNAKHEQLSALTDRIARLRRDLSDIEGRYQTSQQLSDETTDEIGKLAVAQQFLTDEMKRLLSSTVKRDNDPIGGVPVDSRYIVFVIDTSGSMFNTPGNWDAVLEVIATTLDVYPQVEGIQVMSCWGDYMFNSYQGQWIPDSPQRRRQIIAALRTWNPFCDSSPVRGVTQAIDTFYSPDKQISVYYLGDDFDRAGGPIESALRTIDRINQEDSSGERRVRIHAIGFPTIFSLPRRFHPSVYRFATFMRELTGRNGGTFVGLNRTQ